MQGGIKRLADDNTMNSVKLYLKEMQNISILTPEEEYQLAVEVSRGNEAAKQKLIEGNLRLVISIARHYLNCGLMFEDLIQEGNIGLMKAVDKFDVSKGYRFSTFAPWWIRQAISRAIADQGRTIRVPVHITENINKIKKYERELLTELNRDPTPGEIAEKAGLSEDEVIAAMSYIDASSLDVPVGEDDEDTIGDFVEDTRFLNPEVQFFKDQNKNAIDEVLNTLSKREADILRKRFGLHSDKTMTLEEVGKDYHLTKERIRQIENKALMKLRAPARAVYLREAVV